MTVIAGQFDTAPATLLDNSIRSCRINNQGILLTTSASGSSTGETTVGGIYNSASPTFTNGAGAPLQTDVNGNLKVVEQYAPVAEDNTNGVLATVAKPIAVSTYSPSVFTNFGANATLNVKASPGNVFAIHVTNVNAAVRFLQLHNTATVPAGGAVPLLSFAVPLSTGIVIIDQSFFTQGGVFFSTGIAFGFSTTLATYTAGAAGDQSTTILYK